MIRAFHSYRSRIVSNKSLHQVSTFAHENVVGRLLGFIGPVPPPARDKRVSVQGFIITYTWNIVKCFSLTIQCKNCHIRLYKL